jgi:hypothetical protein
MMIKLVLDVEMLTDKQIRIRLDQFLRESIERIEQHPVIYGLSEMNGGRKLPERKNSWAVNPANCMRVSNAGELRVISRRRNHE